MSQSSPVIDITNEERPVGEKVLNFFLRYGGYIALISVFLYFSFNSPIFLTSANMLRILQQSAALALAAFGLTIVVMVGGTHVISGGIDLSIGANVGLVTGVIAVLMNLEYSTPVALGIGLLTGLSVGFINGASVVWFKMLPLLVTLAMLQVVNGLELIVTNNVLVIVDNAFIKFIGNGRLLGMPVVIPGLLIIFALFYLVFHRTRFGIHIQATGGNQEAAIRAGLPVNRLMILTYSLAGFSAWLSSIVVMSRLNGSTRGIGALMLLDILMATYVSAMFSKKWAVNIPGTFLGAIFVGILSNGFTMINVPTYWTFGIKGLLILVVVSATSLQQKRMEK